MSSNVDWYLHEVFWSYLEQVSSYRADTILWRQSSKGNNSKSMNTRVMVLALCTSSNVDWYLYIKFREDSLNGYRADTILWQSPREITH